MHLSDGILNLPTVVATSAAAGAMLVHSVRGIKEEDIPKVSLVTAAFFTISLISIPIGPSSVHPTLGGVVGILLGRRSVIAIFVGLLLQAIFFQHGGLTTLGINTLMLSIPALTVSYLFNTLSAKGQRIPLISALIGALAVIICVAILSVVLYLSNSIYYDGLLSVINLLLVAHIPVVILEGALTMSVISFINRTRPNLLPMLQTSNDLER